MWENNGGVLKWYLLNHYSNVNWTTYRACDMISIHQLFYDCSFTHTCMSTNHDLTDLSHLKLIRISKSKQTKNTWVKSLRFNRNFSVKYRKLISWQSCLCLVLFTNREHRNDSFRSDTTNSLFYLSVYYLCLFIIK